MIIFDITFYIFLSFFFWPYCVWLVGSEFPDQVLNPGASSEYAEF